MKRYLVYWERASEWVDGRNLPTRLAIFLGAGFVLAMIFYWRLLHPIFLEDEAIGNRIKSDITQTRRLEAQLKSITANARLDPDAGNRARAKQLKDDIATTEAELTQLRKELVTPAQMVAMLDAILARHGEVRLVSLTKLPIQSMNTGTMPQGQGSAPQATKNNAPAGQKNDAVYRHGVQVVIEGSYLELLNYVSELEKLPGKLVWGRLDLRVKEYPTAVLTLELFTLSLEKTWLNI